jgi:hypothetical protein
MKTRETDTLEYVTGLAEFDRLACDASFLDFIGMYDAGGARSDDEAVAYVTADPIDAALAAHWVRRLSGARVGYVLDVDDGHDLVELVRFWATRLHVDHERIRLRRRVTRYEPGRRPAPLPARGLITVRSFDPVLRIRMQAWMDKARANLARAAR